MRVAVLTSGTRLETRMMEVERQIRDIRRKDPSELIDDADPLIRCAIIKNQLQVGMLEYANGALKDKKYFKQATRVARHKRILLLNSRKAL
jgi:hypothetical protein